MLSCHTCVPVLCFLLWLGLQYESLIMFRLVSSLSRYKHFLSAVKQVHTALWSHSPDKNIFSDSLKWRCGKSDCMKSIGGVFQTGGPASQKEQLDISFKQWADQSICERCVCVAVSPVISGVTCRERRQLPVSLICDNIRDPGNMAAIITAAAATSLTQVLVTKGLADHCYFHCNFIVFMLLLCYLCCCGDMPFKHCNTLEVESPKRRTTADNQVPSNISTGLMSQQQALCLLLWTQMKTLLKSRYLRNTQLHP